MAELCVFDERITNLKKLSTAIFCRRANPEYEMGMTEAFVKHYPELELTGIYFDWEELVKECDRYDVIVMTGTGNIQRDLDEFAKHTGILIIDADGSYSSDTRKERAKEA